MPLDSVGYSLEDVSMVGDGRVGQIVGTFRLRLASVVNWTRSWNPLASQFCHTLITY